MEELKQERLKRGLSMAKFADLIGVPFKTYEHWERGERECPAYVLRLIKFYLANKKES